MAHLAGDIHIRQEMHFDFYKTVAAAGLAPAALYIEAEPSRAVTPHFCVRRGGKQIPDVVKQPRIGCGIRTGCPADGALVNVNHLVQIFQSLHTAAGAGPGTGVIQPGQQGFVQHLVHQAGFSGAGHAGNAGKGAQRNLHIHIFQIVFTGSPDREEFAVSGSPGSGDGNLLRPGQILTGNRTRAGNDILQGARGHNLAAVAACAGAHIHQKIGGPHGVLVMLHHDQGVAQVPQMLQGCQQLVVIPLVQTNGGLIQDIQHAHQGGTDLGGKADSLALAAGQRARRTGQGEIAQAHIHQELQAGLDFFHNLLRHNGHVPIQLEILHEFQLLPNTHAAEVHNTNAAHRDSLGHGGKPVAATAGAGCRGHAFFQFFSGGIGLSLPIPAGDVIQDSLKGLLQNAHAVAPIVGHAELLSLGAVQDDVHHIPRQLFYRNGEGKVIFLGQCLKIHPEDGVGSGTLPARGLNGTVKNGLLLIRNDQILIRDQLEAQACTAGTGTGGIVKRKHPGLQLRHADAAVLAGIILGKAQLFLLPGNGNGHQAAGVDAGGFDGIGEPAVNSLFQHQTIHNQLHGVLFVFLRFDLLGKVILNAVQPDSGKALLPGILKHLLVLALFPPDHGGQNEKTRALPQGLHPIHDLIDGLAANLFPAFGAVGNAGSGPEQPEVIIDLRHRAHGGAGAFGGGFLVNGNGGREAVDGIHIRLIHLTQKLPCIGAEALHIAALALGVNGIKGQAGLAGAAEPGEHHQLVSGDGEVHVFQVVFSCPLNSDCIVHDICSCCEIVLLIISYCVPSYKYYFKHNFVFYPGAPGRKMVESRRFARRTGRNEMFFRRYFPALLYCFFPPCGGIMAL